MRSPRAVASCSRNPLTSFPVSIASGQAGAQLPSAAQVWIPSCSNSASSASRTGEPSGWRAISRRRRIRWRGVVVVFRDGQTGSHIPHSTQAVASSSIGGVDCRLRRWTPGSRLRITPGPSTPSGSASRLMRHIISVAF